MRHSFAPVLLSVAALSASGDMFPGSVPARQKLAQAESVALGYVTENGGFLPAAKGTGALSVLPGDEQALAAIRARLEKWGRYRVVDNPKLADLRLAVHTGRRVGAGFGTGAERFGGGSARARLGAGEDALWVFEAEVDGGDLLWEDYRGNGLAEPLPLLDSFVGAVEGARASR